MCAGVGGTGIESHVARQNAARLGEHAGCTEYERKHGRGRHATADKCSTGLLHLHLDSEGESDRRWWRVALHWLFYQGQPATVAKRVGIQPVMGPPGGIAVLEAEIRKEERQGLSGSV